MKRVIFSAVLVVLMIGLGVWGLIYTKNVVSDSRSSLAQVSAAYENKDGAGAAEAAKALEQRWNKFCGAHIYISDNEHAMEITNLVARIRYLAQEMDDDLLVECAAADRLLELFGEEQNPNVFNIL